MNSCTQFATDRPGHEYSINDILSLSQHNSCQNANFSLPCLSHPCLRSEDVSYLPWSVLESIHRIGDHLSPTCVWVPARAVIECLIVKGHKFHYFHPNIQISVAVPAHSFKWKTSCFTNLLICISKILIWQPMICRSFSTQQIMQILLW